MARQLKILGFSLLLALAAVLSLPALVIRYVEQVAEKDYGLKLHIESYALSWWEGRLLLEGLSITESLGPPDSENNANTPIFLQKLVLTFSWLNLWGEEIHFNELQLEGLDFAVQGPSLEMLVFGVKIKPMEAGPSSNSVLLGIGLDKLILKDSRIRLQLADDQSDLEIKSLSLDDIHSESMQSVLNASLSVNDSELILDGELRHKQLDFAYSGDFRVLGLSTQALMKFLPHLSSEQLAEDLSALKALIDLDGKLDLTSNRAKLHFVTRLNELEYHYLYGEKLTLGLEADRIEIKGDLDINWQEQLDYKFDGLFEINALHSSASSTSWQDDIVLLTSEMSRVRRLEVKPGFIKVEDLSLTNTILIDNPKFDELFAGLASVSIESLSYEFPIKSEAQKNHTLKLQNIQLEQGQHRLQLDKANIPKTLGQILAQLPPPETSQVEATQMAWQIIDLTVKDLDLVVNSEVFDKLGRQKLNLRRLTLDRLDSLHKSNASEVELEAAYGEFGGLSLQGRFTLLQPSLASHFTAEVQDVPVEDISPIVASMIGYQMISGQYNHQFEVALKNGYLELVNKIQLNQLRLKKLSKGNPEIDLDVPLTLALDLLRNDKNEIRLDIPVSGNLDSPGFSMDKVVAIALTNALKQGSVLALKLALQPYGAIWATAEASFNYLNKISLEPVFYQPLEVTVDQKSQKYLVKIAETLKLKPQLNLYLCGFASEDDLAAYDKMISANAETDAQDTTSDSILHKLATDRQINLKRYMVEKHQIAVARIFTCSPDVNNKFRPASVELGF